MATNYFAQLTDGNIDAANQWNTVANGSGSYLTWPCAADDVLMANGKKVVVNVSATAAQVRNDTTGSATAGGFFDLGNGVTLTAAVYGGNTRPTGNACVQMNLNTPNTATIVGAIYPGTSGTIAYGVSLNSSGTLNITGNCAYQNGSSGSGRVAALNGIGILNITGNVTGGPSSNGYGCATDAAGAFNITGNVTGGSGSSSLGWWGNTSTASFTLIGNATGGSVSGANGVNGVGTINITGTVQATQALGVFLASGTGPFRCVGAIHGSANVAGLVNSGTADCRVTGPFTQTTMGVPAITGLWRFDDSMTSTYYESIDNAGVKRTLYTTNYAVGGLPLAANVRSGTVFGPASELTGTLAVPPAASVFYGVPVDNTTGTAAITAADISAAVWDTLVADLDTANSIGARLAQAATVPSTGAQIAALGV